MKNFPSPLVCSVEGAAKQGIQGTTLWFTANFRHKDVVRLKALVNPLFRNDKTSFIKVTEQVVFVKIVL